MTRPLHIAFVWHMHQPYYKAPASEVFELPWARLHALKDYADMLDVLSGFPDLHQTFNVVPSLAEQLGDYEDPSFKDVYWEHTVIPAADLGRAGTRFVLEHMCENSWHPRAQRFPRYAELAHKREICMEQGMEDCVDAFTTAELRDLQVWFNLAWFDPIDLQRQPLAELVERGRDFREGDKETMAAVQSRLLSRSLAAYRQAHARGQVELTTSPYFHPILPLLINSDTARIARGDIPLPPRRYAHPEDAAEQIDRGLSYHEKIFGHRPPGFWCPEQAVGEDVIPLLARAGIRWTVSDEGVLARSLEVEIHRSEGGRVKEPDLLYRPYRLSREGSEIAIVFRDRILSDLIGFTYQSWAPKDAAANLIWRLDEIRRGLAGLPGPHLVTIALDGENAWEYYQGDGRDFLTRLYADLSADPGFRCVTVSEFLALDPPMGDLPWLHTGSWIYADFSTWLGDPAHGRAWDLLHRARDLVAARRSATARLDGGSPTTGSPDQPTVRAEDAAEQAWLQVLIAQGSDWFWWFGKHQESGMDQVWDARFRGHLQEAYRLLDEAPPPELLSPILAPAPAAEMSHPQTAPLTPVLDGRITWPEEWQAAGVHRTPSRGTMQPGEAPLLQDVRYARDADALHLLFSPGRGRFAAGTGVAVYLAAMPAIETPRLHTDGRPQTSPPGVARTRFHQPGATGAALPLEPTHELRVDVTGPGEIDASLARPIDDGWGSGKPIYEIALDTVIEMSVPLARIGAGSAERLELVVAAALDGALLQLLPAEGTIIVNLRSPGG